MAVTPDRGYSRRGNTSASGDAVFVDLGGGKNLVALLAHVDKSLDLDAINYVALRAYNAAGGKRVNFNELSKMTGVVPVKGELVPVLVTFADPANPGDRPHCIAGRCRRPRSGRAIACAASRPKRCPTASGRSISAARWASP